MLLPAFSTQTKRSLTLRQTTSHGRAAVTEVFRVRMGNMVPPSGMLGTLALWDIECARSMISPTLSPERPKYVHFPLGFLFTMPAFSSIFRWCVMVGCDNFSAEAISQVQVSPYIDSVWTMSNLAGSASEPNNAASPDIVSDFGPTTICLGMHVSI